MLYFPALGALFLAIGIVLERFVLKSKKISVTLYQSTSFIAIVLSMIPFIYFFWRFDAQALQSQNLFLFILVVLLSIVANLFLFYSVKGEKIVKLEPAKALEPMFVIILAIVFSFFVDGLYEKNLKVVIPALISGLVLVLTHIEKHHLNFNKYFLAAIGGSFFFALELVISRLILDFYSPMTFYFLRSISVLALSLVFFRPNLTKLDSKSSLIIFITGAVWATYRIILYYGYTSLGIIFTTLLLMLAPILVYVFAHFFLKERMSWKNFVSAVVIVGSIIYAMVG